VRRSGKTGLPLKERDALGQPVVPLELLVLGVLRVLGRGMCFDGIYELNGISLDVNRRFFHCFCRAYRTIQFPISCAPPTSKEDIDQVTKVYESLGLPGCIGSTDCVHIHWDRCPAALRSLHVGKEGFPTLSYSVTATHSRRIIAVHGGAKGTTNDKTMSKFDSFLKGICDGSIYGQNQFALKNTVNNDVEVVSGLYLICDGGYHKWRTMQCPVKQTSDPDVCHWSRWLESVRKDIECTFGILKGRFRILKVPCLLQTANEIDNVFYTCCALHNEILRDNNLAFLWEQGVEWDGVDGHHDLCDIDKILHKNTIVNDQMRLVSFRVTRTLDMSDRTGTASFFQRDSDLEVEINDSHFSLQKKLVDHFTKQKRDNLLQWR